MSGFHDPYAALNIAPTSDIRLIRQAYIQAVKTTHPDRGGTDEQLLAVQQAYATLKARHQVKPTWLDITVRVSLRDLLYGCIATVSYNLDNEPVLLEFTVPPLTTPGTVVEFQNKGSTTYRIRVRLLEIATAEYVRADSNVVIQRQINRIDAHNGVILEVVNFDGLSHKVKISPETTAASLVYRISGEGFFDKTTRARGDLHIIINVQG